MDCAGEVAEPIFNPCACANLKCQDFLGIKFLPNYSIVNAVPKSTALACETCYKGRGRLRHYSAPSIGVRTPDVTRRWLPLGSGELATGAHFAVELKLKHAHKVRSWLIEPSRVLLKARIPRIQITRAEKEYKLKPRCDSEYQAFFISEENSMKRAVEVGLSHPTGPVVGYFREGHRAHRPVNPSRVAAIVATALANEQILKRLKSAQKTFDYLDVDGVAIILATSQLADRDIEALLQRRLVGRRLSARAEAVTNICRCSPRVLIEAVPEVCEAHREKAICAIFNLNISELVDLLYDWLVALVLDDLSIIVSAAKLTRPAQSRSQTADLVGVVEISTGKCYAYTIAMVDTRPKMPSKIKAKVQSEEGIMNRVIEKLKSKL